MNNNLSIQTGAKNPILRKKSDEISGEQIIQYNQGFFDAMKKVMYEDDGIGLAAPQVGTNLRFVVIGKAASPTNEDLILINPKITFLSTKINTAEEGCLSLPGEFADISRPNKIRFKALNENGEKIEFKAKGLFARVIQHEVDHLDGILFIDRIND
ncbi:peptide deformylase [Patescibacteria group bacterium]|nr:peptide deformylase [Patescibacteria group bacterium]MBU1672903.1 peptide deformylase [Patescibacteria group bacterium]MBU1963154.1 peptide deformylase [Patescibacteria group bacterium]